MYHGISHWPVNLPEWAYRLWRRVMCRQGYHLWDEVLSWHSDGKQHYLVCDACQMVVFIDRIDESYCGDN
jgi:hypothetical protein